VGQTTIFRLAKQGTGARMSAGGCILVRYFIGTSGWHYDDWRNRFYPEKLPKSWWLKFYTEHFPTVELNNTFYRLPSENAVANWHDSSPPDFLFSVKVSRFITHIKRLKDTKEAMDNFMSRMRKLDGKLGPLLYQLPPGMHRNDDVLSDFLAGLPDNIRHVMEFRHESWLENDVFDILRKYHVGMCVFDMPKLSCPLVATADFAYIRFHGRDSLYSSCYSDDELAGWAEKIENIAKTLESVFIYFNNDVQGFALKNAVTLRDYLMKGNTN
jgi:uncharacterized protein YecE (DUF72 family)